MGDSVTCQHCGEYFKYPDLYEEHLLADKSCPVQVELHHLHLVPPKYEKQKRIVQLDTIIPIRVQLVAAWRGGALRWQTVSVISDASFPTETP
jgi:hypothetical protein